MAATTPPEISAPNRIAALGGPPARLLRDLVRAGLDLDALLAAALLVNELDHLAHEDQEDRSERARHASAERWEGRRKPKRPPETPDERRDRLREAGRLGAIERWRRARAAQEAVS